MPLARLKNKTNNKFNQEQQSITTKTQCQNSKPPTKTQKHA